MADPTRHALRQSSVRRAPRCLLCCLALLPLVSSPARAVDGVEVNVVGAALKGKGWPQLIVTINEAVVSVNIELQRSDGTAVHLTAGRLGRGSRKVFELKQPDGGFHYEGKLTARFPQGEPQTLPVSFEAAVEAPPRLTVSDQAVNLATHTATVTADREISVLEAAVRGDDGEVMDNVALKLTDSKANQPINFTWIQKEGAVVLSIEVRVTDKYGFFQNIDLFPWKVEIPHEDVLFDTGKAEIVAAEHPKVEAALTELGKAIEKYGRFAKVQLFVAGYTDTVGDPASNKALSESRALSIARYFRSHGVRIPISYTGFGEDGLLVATPDETAEARNRRAAYIVAIEPPRGAHWSKLP